MQDDELAANHQIFPIEKIGDLLVVSPRGDSMEYSNSAFYSEFNRVKRLARTLDFRNLLIDLSASAYFGSEMIGALVDLRRVVLSRADENADRAKQNGSIYQTGLCGLSPDMAAGLQAMHVDELFVTFDSKNEAVRELAEESVASRVNRLPIPWKSLAAFSVIGVIAAVLIYTPVTFILFGGSAADDYRQVVRIYERWDAKMNQSLSPERKVSVGRSYKREIAALRGATRGQDISPAWHKVVEASRQLAIWIDTPASSSGRENFAEALAIAKAAIEDEAGIELPNPSGLTLPKAVDVEPTDVEASTQKETPEDSSDGKEAADILEQPAG